jgi:glutamine amidotransferase PdxT
MSQPNWVTQPSSVWTADQYSYVFHSINGLLLPGGDPWPQVASPGARQLLALAAEANKAGDYFPVFGTCAGMETLALSG